MLSGERLFLIDPHEKYFQYQGSQTSGYMWNLKENSKEIRRVWQHFEPFHDILGSFQQSFDKGFFGGTLFRFPLRQVTSELCSTVYDGERVRELFAQFESDAHLFLIFLKNVENLELYVRDALESEPRLVFQLAIEAECLDTVRRCRKCFIETIKHGVNLKEDVSITYPLEICTVKYQDGGKAEKKVARFLVNEFHVGAGTMQSVKSLREGPNLSLIPLVGVAMELGENVGNSSRKKIEEGKCLDSSESKEVVNPVLDEAFMNPRGQVFCFLPLPKEEKSASGLPVHVNGYFAVSQNRRHLKWPSIGQKVDSDCSLLWNRCLLSEVLPLSYKELLIHATRSPKVSALDLYHAIPNLVVVDEKWQIVLEPLFRTLFDLPIFFTAVGGGKWIVAEESIFDCMKEEPETKSLIISVLISGGVPVVEVNQHVLHALGAFSNYSPEIITPGVLRNILAGNRNLYVNLEHHQKLLLLRYVLKDEDFRELNGIELLPVLNGTYVRFSKTEQPVYMSTSEFPTSLLPNIAEQFVSDTLDDVTHHKLSKLAQSGGWFRR